MQNKHAIQVGLVTPERLQPAQDESLDAGEISSQLQKETAGALQGTTAAIENQHPDFASLEQSAPAIARQIKAKLIHCAAWLALVFRGVA